MKRLPFVLTLVLALASTLSVSAADLTLTDGRTFHDATILSQTPRKVVIQHADGLSGVEKTLLPADLATRYPVDEAAAREADLQVAAARERAVQFHKTEAERAARVRLEREQTALHNAQIAALEATERLAEAEAARIASQRTEVVYEYVSFNRAPYYIHSPSRHRGYEPRWNEKPRNHRLVRDDHTPHRDHPFATDRRSPRQNVINTPTNHRTPHQPATPRPSQQTRRTDDERAPAKPSAAVARP